MCFNANNLPLQSLFFSKVLSRRLDLISHSSMKQAKQAAMHLSFNLQSLSISVVKAYKAVTWIFCDSHF
jgi:hypothetical protein